MSYTVKKLAELSGVSARTLRFYDEIGLLKPAYYGNNHYRYYEEEQLLMLQQILFFRELGFSLRDVQKIISGPAFDKIAALQTHQITLQKSLDKTQTLIKTINKTISYLRGSITMRNIGEIYEGFQSKIEKLSKDCLQEYKQAALEDGLMTAQDLVEMEKTEAELKNWKMEDFLRHSQLGEAILKRFVELIDTNMDAQSLEVQALVAEHYQWTAIMSGPISKHAYYHTALSNNYPRLINYYEAYHPQLRDYLLAAMKFFADRAA